MKHRKIKHSQQPKNVTYTNMAEFCMIAPDEDALFNAHNDVSGCGS